MNSEEGDTRRGEGVLDKTAAPRIVFEWMIHHTTVLVRGVCVCAVHLTVNLRSIVGQGEEEDPSCTSSDAYPRMMSYAPKKWLRSSLLWHQSVA